MGNARADRESDIGFRGEPSSMLTAAIPVSGSIRSSSHRLQLSDSYSAFDENGYQDSICIMFQHR
jgi:hypothetical protein